MSSIPNPAMPRANAPDESEEKKGTAGSIKTQAGKVAEKAKDNPKTAIAAGVAVAAGLAAAAAIPLVRAARSKGSEKKASGGSKKKKD